MTHLDMGILQREGYEDQLTVAYIALMNHINKRGRGTPARRPPDAGDHRRGSHHHDQPAARPVRDQDHQDVAQVRGLVLDRDPEPRRLPGREPAHALDARVVAVPGHAEGRGQSRSRGSAS